MLIDRLKRLLAPVFTVIAELTGRAPPATRAGIPFDPPRVEVQSPKIFWQNIFAPKTVLLKPAVIDDFVTVDGVRLHFIDTGGAGQALLMLHGNGASVSDMVASGLVAAASGRYRVIVFDRPGFGQSDRPRGKLWTPEAQAGLFDRALGQLGIDRPIVLGHSWGALVALALAIDHPKRVAGLVLASGYYFPTPRVDVLLVAATTTPVLGDLMRHALMPVIRRSLGPALVRNIFAPQAVPPRFAAEFPLNRYPNPSQMRASSEETMLMIPATMRLRQRYGALRLPVAIVAGDKDQIVNSARHSGRLGKAIVGSKFSMLPGLGHMIHYFATDRIVEAIDLVRGRLGLPA